MLEEVTRASGQEPYAQKAQKRRKSEYTVCLFSNETKDDGINPKPIEIIKFRKKFLKEYVLAFICAKS